MGRKVRRVGLDFDWPQDKPWKGFVNPHYVRCGKCDGDGVGPDRQWLGQIVHLLMIAGSDGARGRMHPWLTALPLAPRRPVTVEMARLTSGLAGRKPSSFGHDAIDRWVAEKAILKAAGLSDKWGTCEACKGEGVDPKYLKAYEEWKKEEPPTGPGWQMWETTSEGSPISPVFETSGDLAVYLARRYPGDGTYEQWLEFIEQGGEVPSMVAVDGVVRTGAAILDVMKKKG